MDIINSELVVKEYGQWPCFHDAEILKLSLERSFNTTDLPNMLVDIRIRRFSAINVGTRDYQLVAEKDHIISLEFSGVEQCVIDGFNHQNVLDGLHLTKSSGGFQVEFEACYGAQACFKCQQVAVTKFSSFTLP